MLKLAHTIRRKQIRKGKKFFAPTTQVPAGHIKKEDFALAPHLLFFP